MHTHSENQEEHSPVHVEVWDVWAFKEPFLQPFLAIENTQGDQVKDTDEPLYAVHSLGVIESLALFKVNDFDFTADTESVLRELLEALEFQSGQDHCHILCTVAIGHEYWLNTSIDEITFGHLEHINICALQLWLWYHNHSLIDKG